jgi:hypothetical protein
VEKSLFFNCFFSITALDFPLISKRAGLKIKVVDICFLRLALRVFVDLRSWRWSSAPENRRDLPQLDNAILTDHDHPLHLHR